LTVVISVPTTASLEYSPVTVVYYTAEWVPSLDTYVTYTVEYVTEVVTAAYVDGIDYVSYSTVEVSHPSCRDEVLVNKHTNQNFLGI